jgi:plastocyanin
VSRGTVRPSRATVAAAVLLLLTACGGSGQPTPFGTPAVTLQLAAQDIKFDQATLTVPADAPFAIAFNNRESALHNVTIRKGGTNYFQGELFSGPAARTYFVPPLPAGQYEFLCDVHPDMTGTLTSQ